METQQYQTILVGIDGSPQAELAFEKAVEVGRRNQARVIVAHIIENQLYNVMGYSAMNENLLDQETDSAKEMLKQCKEYAKSVGYDNVEAILSYGSPKEIMCVELPKKYHVDLIMVGQSGLNAVERLIIGSVSSHIIRQAPCDVLVVYPEK